MHRNKIDGIIYKQQNSPVIDEPRLNLASNKFQNPGQRLPKRDTEKKGRKKNWTSSFRAIFFVFAERFIRNLRLLSPPLTLIFSLHRLAIVRIVRVASRTTPEQPLGPPQPLLAGACQLRWKRGPRLDNTRLHRLYRASIIGSPRGWWARHLQTGVSSFLSPLRPPPCPVPPPPRRAAEPKRAPN